MSIKFLADLWVRTIYLAGFDGYSHDAEEYYGDGEMAFVTRIAVLDAMNSGMSKVLKDYSSRLSINFLTTPKHLKV